ncbi:MAG: hypothetical protein GF350_07320 [Chitinivibrionales bacterium]|nr:hypothetical protein [Chitinivibrionales bacterium]
MNNNRASCLCILGVLLSVPFFFGACGGESESNIRKKLDVILEDDCAAIVEGIPDSSILDSVYYETVEYKKYSKGKYIRKAVVDFYFLRGVAKKIRRKYRYHNEWGKWDRYHNRWISIPDKQAPADDVSPR